MNSARLDEGRMRGMQDVAEFTSSLIEWAGDLLPDLTIRAVSARSALPQDKASESDAVLVRLASVEGSNGPRSGDAISRRLTLEYEFDLGGLDPPAEHQALADLTFALLERPDLAEGHSVVRGERSSVRACFTIVRRTDLPKARPVREAIFDLHANARIVGRVRSDGDVSIPRARIRIAGSDRLIITDRNGEFEFAAPAGIAVKARISAKGKDTDVELTPGQPNIITLPMEA